MVPCEQIAEYLLSGLVSERFPAPIRIKNGTVTLYTNIFQVPQIQALYIKISRLSLDLLFRDSKSKLQDSKTKLLDSETKLQDSKSKLQDSKSKLLNSKSKLSREILIYNAWIFGTWKILV